MLCDGTYLGTYDEKWFWVFSTTIRCRSAIMKCPLSTTPRVWSVREVLFPRGIFSDLILSPITVNKKNGGSTTIHHDCNLFLYDCGYDFEIESQSVTSYETMFSPKNSKTENPGQNFRFVRTLIFDGQKRPASHKVWCTMSSGLSKTIKQINKI